MKSVFLGVCFFSVSLLANDKHSRLVLEDDLRSQKRELLLKNGDIKAAKAELEFRKEHYSMVETAFKKKAVTEYELREAKKNLRLADLRVVEIELERDWLETEYDLTKLDIDSIKKPKQLKKYQLLYKQRETIRCKQSEKDVFATRAEASLARYAYRIVGEAYRKGASSKSEYLESKAEHLATKAKFEAAFGVLKKCNHLLPDG